MIRICCVCKKIVGEKEPLEDKSETHTVCKDCFQKEIEKQEKAIAERRESSSVPVFILRISSRRADEQKDKDEQNN